MMSTVELPLGTIATIGLLSLLPFVLLATTSFVKMSVVLSALRSALGFGAVPSAMVVTVLAGLLSVHVMAPVVERMVAAGAAPAARIDFERPFATDGSAEAVRQLWQRASEPMRGFLSRHAHADELALFKDLAERAPAGPTVDQRDFRVLLPAFLISELGEAFQVAFLLLLPFVVIDVVIASVLVAMQLHSLSPALVSLPLKVLLFVMVDGFAVLSEALIASYS
ncbi:MAG: flagellar type III secretion system pore protein FliP [Myxococcales bacterium]|nr:flagellar type III secretion system pore protein FliP [Myxococcales bacterium]